VSTRILAGLYRENQKVQEELKRLELAFRIEHAELYASAASLKESIEVTRNLIAMQAVAGWLEDGSRPEAPLGLQIRHSAVLLDVKALATWAHENMPELLKLDEKAAKAYVETQAGKIVSEDGVILAHTEEVPVLVAGEKTLISWLQEQEWLDAQKEERA